MHLFTVTVMACEGGGPTTHTVGVGAEFDKRRYLERESVERDACGVREKGLRSP